MGHDFSKRNDLQELMDDPGADPAEIEGTVEGLARVNTLLGGYGPSIEGVERLAGDSKTLSILDVGTGCADTPRRLVEWASWRGIDVFVKGIDLSPVIAEYGRKRCVAYRNIEVQARDIFEMDDEERFDVVHAALMLHHLSDDDIVGVLEKMFSMSRLGVVINDLHRHRLGYYGSRIILPFISRNHFVRHDGPVSVLRAFTRHELEDFARRAGISLFEIRWMPLFRWQLILFKEPR